MAGVGGTAVGGTGVGGGAVVGGDSAGATVVAASAPPATDVSLGCAGWVAPPAGATADRAPMASTPASSAPQDVSIDDSIAATPISKTARAPRTPSALQGTCRSTWDPQVSPLGRGYGTIWTIRRPEICSMSMPTHPGATESPQGRNGRVSSEEMGRRDSSPTANPWASTLQPEW